MWLELIAVGGWGALSVGVNVAVWRALSVIAAALTRLIEQAEDQAVRNRQHHAELQQALRISATQAGRIGPHR